MSYKVSNELADAILAAAKAQLDGGFLYLYAGAVPGAPSDALDMTTAHTEVAKVALNGSAGLVFDAPSAAAMSKPTAAQWTAVAAFSGAGSALPELTATFFRFCKAADNGRGAGTSSRLQGTIGVPGSGADMERSSTVIPAAAALSISTFAVRIGSIG